MRVDLDQGVPAGDLADPPLKLAHVVEGHRRRELEPIELVRWERRWSGGNEMPAAANLSRW